MRRTGLQLVSIMVHSLRAPFLFKILHFSPIFCLIDETCQISNLNVQIMPCKTHFLSPLFPFFLQLHLNITTQKQPIHLPQKAPKIKANQDSKVNQTTQSKISFSRFEIPKRDFLVLRIFSSRGFLSSLARKFQIFVTG